MNENFHSSSNIQNKIICHNILSQFPTVNLQFEIYRQYFDLPTFCPVLVVLKNNIYSVYGFITNYSIILN